MSRVSIALSFAAVVAVITPAAAADMYGSNSRAPSSNYGYSDGGSSPAQQWAGGYAGAQVGYGWGEHGINGAQGGVFGGGNFAVGTNIVLGAEAEVNVSGQERASVIAGGLVKQSSAWNGALRVRAGVAYDKVMPYASVGVAIADDTVKAFGANDTTTKVGYQLGAGVEGKISDRVSLRGELVHTGFGRTDHVANWATVGSNVSTTTLRAGAAYKF